MDINNLIVKMSQNASSEDTYHNQDSMTISITALEKFAKLFALAVLHDTSLQNAIMKETI